MRVCTESKTSCGGWVAEREVKGEDFMGEGGAGRAKVVRQGRLRLFPWREWTNLSYVSRLLGAWCMSHLPLNLGANIQAKL